MSPLGDRDVHVCKQIRPKTAPRARLPAHPLWVILAQLFWPTSFLRVWVTSLVQE